VQRKVKIPKIYSAIESLALSTLTAVDWVQELAVDWSRRKPLLMMKNCVTSNLSLNQIIT
jgi:hypothetical protein